LVLRIKNEGVQGDDLAMADLSEFRPCAKSGNPLDHASYAG
jgi:hypothetical protein